MLFSEQVRILKDEEELVKDTTVYGRDTICDWTTMVSKTITLNSQKIVGIRFTVEYTSGGGGAVFAARVLLNNNPIISTGYSSNLTPPRTRLIYLLLDAGNYTFDFQLSIIEPPNSGYPVKFTSIQIGVFNFTDKLLAQYNSGFISCPATSTTTLIDQNFTTPASRRLALGSIKKYIAHIFVYAERENQRVSKMKNVGESNEANFFNWRILLNDNQVNWTDRVDDCGADTSNPTYGEGAYGRLSIALDPNTQYNLKINCYNGFSSAYNGRVIVSIIICPWILPDTDTEVISLDFPQGSTLYVITEPLADNPTKYIKIGKKRGISFGDNTDYYSLTSGTGILSHSYTFEIIDVSNSVLLVSGFGGCISALAVDVR
ncbi:MAG: hypothetical protein QXF43_04185 [Nitrososphaerales archaeon]